jgi:hypothetical protein
MYKVIQYKSAKLGNFIHNVILNKQVYSSHSDVNNSNKKLTYKEYEF